MALTTQQNREIAIALVRLDPTLASMSKTEIIAAAAAADQWSTDNSTSYNTALPVPFRTTASASAKAALLYLVGLRRYAG